MDEGSARRAALDHVLALVTGSDIGDALILRGSMTMLAYAGIAAREPGDLDWVVRPALAVPCDDRHPYPYVDSLEPVQHWPEAVHGAARNEFWELEEFEKGGQRPVLPPEGLTWVAGADLTEDLATWQPHYDVLDLIRARPEAPGGVVLAANDADADAAWAYGYTTDDGGTPGARVVIPWTADGLPPGSVQLDFAYDETVPEPPALAAIPRGDGRAPVPVWAASRGLSLAWKLLWLSTDQTGDGVAQGKDLYDAVLLAEDPRTRLTPRLRRTVLRGVDLGPDAIRGWAVDPAGVPTGSVAQWLDRLAAAPTWLDYLRRDD